MSAPCDMCGEAEKTEILNDDGFGMCKPCFDESGYEYMRSFYESIGATEHLARLERDRAEEVRRG